MNVADIVQHQLVDGCTAATCKPEVGEHVTLAGQAGKQTNWSGSPEQPFPGEGEIHEDSHT